MIQKLTKQINGRGQWILLALLLFCTDHGLAQDTLPNNNSIRLGFGPSYTGLNVDISYARVFGKHEVGFGGLYVLAGTLNSDDGSFGARAFWNYHPLRSAKMEANIGPSISFLQVHIDDRTDDHYYFELYLNIGIRHHVFERIDLGYEVGYGAVYIVLSDRFSDDRPTDFDQASTLKIFTTYKF